MAGGMGTVRDVSTDLVERHRPRLEAAIAAIGDRGYWSSFAEDPRDYPEDAAAAGTAAFEAHRGKPFPIEQPATATWAGEERSPYGLELGITYPVADARRPAALDDGRDPRLARRRARGPRRGLRGDPRAAQRAVARDRERRDAHHRPGVPDGVPGRRPARAGPGPRGGRVRPTRRMRRAPGVVDLGEAPGQAPTRCAMAKRFTVVPRGVSLLIGCNTFPTWNGYPGLFASLATGNPVLVKPHRARRAAARDHRRGRPARCSPRPASTRTWSALAVERAGRAARRRPSRCAPRSGIIDYTGSTRVRRLAGGPRPPGRRSTRRRPASTRSSSTPPTTTRACSATSPSRCRCTAARCAPPRRTCWCPATASTPTQGPGRSTRSRRTSPARSTGCSATEAGGRDPRRDRRTRRARAGRRRRAASATSSWRRTPSSIPSSPPRSSARRLLVALPASTRARVRPGVLRAGRFLVRTTRHGRGPRDLCGARCSSTGR